MNELLIHTGLLTWKPLLGMLVMPPIPLLLLAVLGAWWLPRRRWLGWTLVLCALLGLWAMCTSAVGQSLLAVLTRPPATLNPSQVAALANAPRTAIVVLGAGVRAHSAEYGAADLRPLTLERLRYGLWLARQTGLPVAFSGGVALGALPGTPTEADTAARLAKSEFGTPLRWLETKSRDTHENAQYSVELLQAAGIQRIVLVTHGFHQQRALAGFRQAIQRGHVTMEVIPASLGVRVPGPFNASDYWPTPEGFVATRLALHEWLGYLGGA